MPVIFHQQIKSLFTLSGAKSHHAQVESDAVPSIYEYFPNCITGVLRQFAWFPPGSLFLTGTSFYCRPEYLNLSSSSLPAPQVFSAGTVTPH